jgi:hypothetical protein
MERVTFSLICGRKRPQIKEKTLPSTLPEAKNPRCGKHPTPTA